MAEKYFVLRDADSTVSTGGINISKMRILSASLNPLEEAIITLEPKDHYVWVYPLASYAVSYTNNIPASPPVGGMFNVSNSLLNIYHFGLEDWPPDPNDLTQKRIYIQNIAAGISAISVLIGKR